MAQAQEAYPFDQGVELDGTALARLDVDSWDAISLQWYTGSNNTGSASSINLYGTVFRDVPADSADVRWDPIGATFSALPASGEGASEVLGVSDGYRTVLIEIVASSLSEFTLAARVAASR